VTAGVVLAGIGRLGVLRVVQRGAVGVGVRRAYGVRIDDAANHDADLVIGGDGLNSIVRRSGDFGDAITHQTNHFVWYGANREFDALTQTFIDTAYGPMNAHHYTYASGRSTFIIEAGAATFERAQFGEMDEPGYRAICEAAFADVLGGAQLIANKSDWRRFPHLSCARWHDGRRVLVGDALHTAHFSIGSGTRLALEDVLALVAALKRTDWDVSSALPAYQAARAPVLAKLTAAARRSADWYDGFDAHMALEPWPFALSYIRRAGRLTSDRLRRMAPAFSAALDARGVALEQAA